VPSGHRLFGLEPMVQYRAKYAPRENLSAQGKPTQSLPFNEIVFIDITAAVLEEDSMEVTKSLEVYTRNLSKSVGLSDNVKVLTKECSPDYGSFLKDALLSEVEYDTEQLIMEFFSR
jgi:hypothetical protein